MNKLYSVAVPLIIASGTFPTIPTLRHAGPPTSGIVATDDGTIFFVDSFHRTVWRLAESGRLTPFVTGRNGRALGVDEAGHVYGTHEDESGRVAMWRANCNGTVVELSHTDVPEYGHAFVVDDDGEVIASSGSGKRTGVRLWRTSEDDRELLAGGDMGMRDGTGPNAQFLPIGGMTRTKDGEVLVTSGASIRRIRSDGSVYTIAKGERLLKPRFSFLARLLGDVSGHLSGIAVGSDGEIYVANSARNAVVRINRDGSAEELMESESGWTPTGVATSNGALFILEYGTGVRVSRLDANGALTIIAHVRPNRAMSSAMALGRMLMPATPG